MKLALLLHFYQPFNHRYAGLPGITCAGGGGGIGYAHDNIGFDGVFTGESGAHSQSGGIKQFAINHAIKTGKVNKLENAGRFLARFSRVALNAIFINHHYLIGLDFPHKFRADMIEGAGFRSYCPTAIYFSHAERPDAHRVAHGVKCVRRQDNQ